MTLFGPVFVKELIETSRRPRYHVLRAALAVIALGIISVAYLEAPRQYGVRQSAQFGHEIFCIGMWLDMIGIGLLGPIMITGLIASEKDRKTLEILFTTPLSNREILWGKLASRLVILLLMLISTTPVLVILGLFGGIDFEQLLLSRWVTISALCLECSIGLYFSIVTSKAWVALLRTLAVGIFGWLLLPIGTVALIDWLYPQWFNVIAIAGLLRFAVVYHPALMQAVIIFPGAPLPVSLLQATLEATTTWLIAAAGLFSLSCYHLRKCHLIDDTPLVLRLGRLLSRWLGRCFGWLKVRWPRLLSDEQKRQFLEVNPILFRNVLSRYFDRGQHLRSMQHLAAIVLYCCLTYVFCEAHHGRKLTEYFAAILTVGMAVFHGFLGIYAANSIACERDRGTFEVLLTTPITARQLILGNYVGAFAPLTIFLLLAGVTLASAWFSGGFMSLSFTLLYGLVMATATAHVAAAALLQSATARTSGHALAATVGLGMWFWIGPMMLDNAMVMAIYLMPGMVLVGLYCFFGRRRFPHAGAVLVALSSSSTLLLLFMLGDKLIRRSDGASFRHLPEILSYGTIFSEIEGMGSVLRQGPALYLRGRWWTQSVGFGDVVGYFLLAQWIATAFQLWLAIHFFHGRTERKEHPLT